MNRPWLILAMVTANLYLAVFAGMLAWQAFGPLPGPAELPDLVEGIHYDLAEPRYGEGRKVANSMFPWPKQGAILTYASDNVTIENSTFYWKPDTFADR